jgi:Flp pilus assembly protein TadD
MTMNNVAWLDAKCDENLGEALALATSAVNEMPRAAELIDTLAEVTFHLGHFQQAVALEKRAVALTPDEVLLHYQLHRFEAGAAAATRPATAP